LFRLIRSGCLVVALIGAGVSSAYAQRGLDVFAGVGTVNNSSNGQTIDTFGDGTLYGTPKMTGAFGKFGAGFMLTPHFGVNGEADVRFSQGDYAGLKYRPTFYDFNAVWMPAFRRSRVQPEFQGGLGAMNLRYYYAQQYCDSFTGCSTSSSYLESANHLQVHMAAGVRFYVTNHFFVRPQIDAHYVNNLNQFGSNWVPEYGATIGYTFGER
jgi:hypothetical protein